MQIANTLLLIVMGLVIFAMHRYFRKQSIVSTSPVSVWYMALDIALCGFAWLIFFSAGLIAWVNYV